MSSEKQLLADEAAIVDLDELRPLIAEGHEKGVLTFEQIAAALEEVEVTKEQVQELHAYLDEQGIDVVGADGRAAAEQEPERVAAVVLSAPTGDPTARDWARTAASTLAALRRDDVADRLSRMSCPALVLRGERDAIAPQGWAEHVARQLPRGRLVVLSGQPHNALTLAAHEAAALVRAFLTEVLEA